MTVKKKAKRLTLQQSREQVKTEWIKVMQLHHCATPEQMQLLIIFQMLRTYLLDEAYASMDEDAKERINYQQALFEKSMEEQYFRDQLNKIKGF